MKALAYSGLYATWRRTGGYVDVSMRWMDFDAHPVGAAGDWRTDGHARAFNLEAGYTGWNPAGIALVPQLQYTRATVSGISPMSGTLVDFTAEGGNAERVRVGLDASRAFAGGRHRARWTPYGAVGVVREMGGGSTYAVGGNAAFSGASRNQGTHVLLEAGLGMQAGGLSATVGLHWADGGSIDNTTGGQVVLRYAW